MRNAILLARQAAQADSPILLTGETGVGKEVLARAIHAWSRRHDGPFVAVNCAALPAGLRESELFGHAAGAFSGAIKASPGRFQEAEGGTLLLDEVGELDPAAQAMLLRVLQEKVYEPVGSDRSRRADVRILAATNRDLEAEVAAGRFRRDLWYRLSVFPLHIPPLRDRREDIADLAAAWLDRHARRTGRGPWTLHAGAVDRLRAYPWPGNVRELLNSLERATILAPAGGLEADYFPAIPVPAVARVPANAAPAPASATPTLAEQEDAAIRAALVRCRGRIYGPLGAAAELGLKPSTLQSRMRKRGIPRVPPA
jgi:transcriptional regulator with GAF, ATPase, and Fis domain